MPQRPLYLAGTVDSAGPLKDLMTRPVIKVGLSTKISAIEALFNEFKIHHIPVVDDQDHIQGMISENDVKRYKNWSARTQNNPPEHLSVSTVKAEEVMSEKVLSINESANLIEAATIMNAHRFHCLPVVNDQHVLVGILTAHDLIRLAYPGS